LEIECWDGEPEGQPGTQFLFHNALNSVWEGGSEVGRFTDIGIECRAAKAPPARLACDKGLRKRLKAALLKRMAYGYRDLEVLQTPNHGYS
jgi:hypothetical protein